MVFHQLLFAVEAAQQYERNRRITVVDQKKAQKSIAAYFKKVKPYVLANVVVS